MRAAVCDQYGPPEIVRIDEVEKPSPQGGEVLIKVHATTVNRTDCGVRAPYHPLLARFFYGWARPRARVLGNEFAGEVEAVGVGVTSFKPGDRVFGFNAGFGARGEFGAHAEYLVTRAGGSIATMPAGMTYEEAAPCTEGSTYALATIEAAGIHDGHDVLVYGATGSIGSSAVQLLKSIGARVTGVCATPHLDLVKNLGADRVVDYTAGDFTNDEQRYDVVFDAVGKTTFGRCRRLLKEGGLFMAVDAGPYWQNLPLALVTPLFRGKRVVMSTGLNRHAVGRVRDLIESGRFRPVIDRRYPLDQIVEAYRYVETRQKVGGVVISVLPPD